MGCACLLWCLWCDDADTSSQISFAQVCQLLIFSVPYSLPARPPLAHLQAWYREGRAAAGLQRWEDAASAFYQAAALQPENEEFLRLTKEAIQEGRKELAAQQRQGGAAAPPAALSAAGSGGDS